MVGIDITEDVTMLVLCLASNISAELKSNMSMIFCYDLKGTHLYIQ